MGKAKLMQTAAEVIKWAENLLKVEGHGRRGQFKGETQNGFYITFWKPDFHSMFVNREGVMTPRPVPGSTSSLFISKSGFGVIRLGFPPPVPPLMFDHYLNEGKLHPKVVLGSNGNPIKIWGIDLFEVDQKFMIQKVSADSTKGIVSHLKYGEFSTPDQTIEP